MNLKETEYTVDISALNINFMSYDLNASLSYNSANSYFNPYTLTIHSKQPFFVQDSNIREFISADKVYNYYNSELSKISDKNEKALFLIRETTWQHEVRHFHDCFCTRVGINDFLFTQFMFGNILSQLLNIKEEGRIINQPLFKILYQKGKNFSNELPELKIFEILNTFKLYKAFFNGDIGDIFVPYDYSENDIVWLVVKGPMLNKDIRIASVPIRFLSPSDGQKFCKLVPLGFRSIIENSAVTMQKHLFIHWGYGELSQIYTDLLRTQVEYASCNIFLTKITKKFGFYKRFEEEGVLNKLYEVLDLTLHNSSLYIMDEYNTHPSIFMINNEIRKLYNQKSVKTNIGNSKLDGWNLDLNILKNSNNFLDAFQYYVLNECWIKSCNIYNTEKQKLDITNNRDLHDPLFYFHCAHKIPNPPFSIQGQSKFGFGDKLDNLANLRYVLQIWIIFVETVNTILNDPILRCPFSDKYNRQYSYSFFYPHQYCEKYIMNNNCGKCHLGDNLEKHVNCLWKRCATDWALAK